MGKRNFTMRVSRLSRRDFINSCLLAGLLACGGPTAGRLAAKKATRNDGLQPFYEKLGALADRVASGEITPEFFTGEVGKHLMALEIEQGVIEDWMQVGPSIPGVGKNGYRILEKRKIKARGDVGAILFYTPPGISNPPHEHHNLISCKRVLVGSYHVRQYDRLKVTEPGVLALRQATELPDVGFHHAPIEMTDYQHGVHWFGAKDEGVLAFNINSKGALPLNKTFHGESETRPSGRYFVDPTAAPNENGVIRCPIVSDEEALAFSQKRLDAFPDQRPG